MSATTRGSACCWKAGSRRRGLTVNRTCSLRGAAAASVPGAKTIGPDIETADAELRRLPRIDSPRFDFAKNGPLKGRPRPWNAVRAGYPAGTGGVERCQSLRPAPVTRCAAVQRICPSGEDSRDGGTAMVRKGSPVRVRQRALEKAPLRRGFCLP
jgi:hypothetical protein